jgi:hypothetical protein
MSLLTSEAQADTGGDAANPGEGGLHWEESRQLWFATVYIGCSPSGKRRKIKVSARTKTEVKGKVRQLIRDRDDGQVLGGQTYTVRDAVARAWPQRTPGVDGGQSDYPRPHACNPGARGTEACTAIGRKKLISGWPRKPRP